MSKRTCEFGDGQPVVGRNWCRKHYTRWSRHGDPLWGENLPPVGTMGVYSITCLVNGWVYIGSSMSIRKRWSCHKSWLRHGTQPVRRLQADYDTYGADAFSYDMISVVYDPDERLACEQEHLTAALATGKCYNPCPTVDGTGYTLTAEQRARLSAAMTAKPKSAEHRANLWRDREVTDEFRQRMAANGRRQAGRPKSAETRQKMSEAQIGGRTVLTEAIVRQIKRLIADNVTNSEIARQFRITPGAVSAIRTGRNWSHVTLEAAPEPTEPGTLF